MAVEIKKSMDPITKIKLDKAIKESNWEQLIVYAGKGYLAAIEAAFKLILISQDKKFYKNIKQYYLKYALILIKERSALYKEHMVAITQADIPDGIKYLLSNDQLDDYYLEPIGEKFIYDYYETAIETINNYAPGHAYIKKLLLSAIDNLYDSPYDVTKLFIKYISKDEYYDFWRHVDSEYDSFKKYVLITHGTEDWIKGKWEDKYSLDDLAEVAIELYSVHVDEVYETVSGFFEYENGISAVEKFFSSLKEHTDTDYNALDDDDLYYEEARDYFGKQSKSRSICWKKNLADFYGERWQSYAFMRDILWELYQEGFEEYGKYFPEQLMDNFSISDGYDKLAEAVSNGYIHARIPYAQLILSKYPEKMDKAVIALVKAWLDGDDRAYNLLGDCGKVDYRVLDVELQKQFKGKLEETYLSSRANTPANLKYAYFSILNKGQDKGYIQNDTLEILKDAVNEDFTPAKFEYIHLCQVGTEVEYRDDKSKYIDISDELYIKCMLDLYNQGNEEVANMICLQPNLITLLPIEEQIKLYESNFSTLGRGVPRLAELYLAGEYNPAKNEEGQKIRLEILQYIVSSESIYDENAAYELASILARKGQIDEAEEKLEKIISDRNFNELWYKAELMLGIIQISKNYESHEGYIELRSNDNATAKKIVEAMRAYGISAEVDANKWSDPSNVKAHYIFD